MPAYRIYFFNEKGHIASTRELSCFSDAEALAEAGRLRHPHPMEVWDQGRLVARLDRERQKAG